MGCNIFIEFTRMYGALVRIQLFVLSYGNLWSNPFQILPSTAKLAYLRIIECICISLNCVMLLFLAIIFSLQNKMWLFHLHWRANLLHWPNPRSNSETNFFFHWLLSIWKFRTAAFLYIFNLENWGILTGNLSPLWAQVIH